MKWIFVVMKNLGDFLKKNLYISFDNAGKNVEHLKVTR